MTKNYSGTDAPPGLLIRGVTAGICCPFLVSAVMKLSHPAEAASEMAALGMAQPLVMAMGVASFQLLGTVLAVAGRGRWAVLGACALAGFTVAATLLVHAFWNFDGPARVAQTNTFVEHVSIFSALLLVAWLHGRGQTVRWL